MLRAFRLPMLPAVGDLREVGAELVLCLRHPRGASSLHAKRGK